MSFFNRRDIIRIYSEFTAPLCKQDCGKRCAPHNEGGHPFCCDTRHAVPTAYATEWEYLKSETGLWHLWQGENRAETARLEGETPAGLRLIECLGSDHCQRDYRSITCRAFPFFPYIDSCGVFLGMTYYHEYRDRCWIISHLEEVTQEFQTQFIRAYEYLFARMPVEKENFSAHSAEIRRVYSQSRRRIHILHRDGKTYAISPHSEKIEEITSQSLPRFGIYQLIAELTFPDESDDI
jgi:hypothetical protein